MKEEIKVVNDELAKNTDWEYIDPLDLKPDDMSEFSIYNLKSLFNNLYHVKKISNKYTTLTVFLVIFFFTTNIDIALMSPKI